MLLTDYKPYDYKLRDHSCLVPLEPKATKATSTVPGILEGLNNCYRWIDGGLDGWTDGQTDGWMNGWMHEFMCRWMDT